MRKAKERLAIVIKYVALPWWGWIIPATVGVGPSLFLLVRDEFLPSEWRDRFMLLEILPWWGWLFVGLIFFVAFSIWSVGGKLQEFEQQTVEYEDKLIGKEVAGVEIEPTRNPPDGSSYLSIKVTNNSERDISFYGVWLLVRCMNDDLEKVRQHSNFISWSGGDDEKFGAGKGRKIVPSNGGVGFLNLVEIQADKLKFWTTAGPTEHGEFGIYMLVVDVRGDFGEGAGKTRIRPHPAELMFLFWPNTPNPLRLLPIDAILGRGQKP